MSTPANRFVRFGYRRPPPWTDTDLPHLNKARPPISSTTKTTSVSASPPISSSLRKLIANGIDNWSSISTSPIPLTPVPIPQRATVPTLAHGLDITLKGDGLYPLEAPWLLPKRPHRSKVPKSPPIQTHFSDSLRHIVHPDRIAWTQIPPYIPAAHDAKLHSIAARTTGVQFCSSTSSVTPSLSAFYHLISNFMDTALNGGLSLHVKDLPATFSRIHRRPVALTLSPIRNVIGDGDGRVLYSVNAHSGVDRGPSILRDLGHSMERMFTTPPDLFAEKYVRHFVRDPIHAEDDVNFPEQRENAETSTEEQFYHYTHASKTMLRAQIDCRDERTGQVFDVKTRAVAPIRYDLENYEAFTSHRLRFLHGRSDSYEREFYDMVRSVFLKYALQLRIGRMAGALVAYHNTTEVLGLEFISLAEMESYVFGNGRWADVAFASCVRLWEEVLCEVGRAMAPMGEGEKVKVVLCTEWAQLKMMVFAQRVKKGENGDAFSCEEFAARMMEGSCGRVASTTSGAFRRRSQWHFDSYVHKRRRGVSIVGAHEVIRGLGGERIDRQAGTPQRKAGLPANAMDYRKYDWERLSDGGELKAWELAVVPMVNGGMVWNEGKVQEKEDNFSLRYTLSKVEVTTDVVSRFVLALSTVYLR